MYRKMFTGIIITVVIILGILLGSSLSSPDKEKTKKTGKAGQVERGKYLVDFGGCNDCHSPKNFTDRGPVFDHSRLLSGHPAGTRLPEIDPRALEPGNWALFSADLTAAVGPWGISYAANLTPDNQTGIGLWTEEVFIQAMRTGLHMGAGRPILPPMPYESVASLTDEDLKAVFAYLKSLPAIKNQVPAPLPPNEVAQK